VVFTRSRTLHHDQLETHSGLRYTSRVRTLVDILSVVDLTEGERLLESALRGVNAKRPDLWRTADLDELSGFIERHPRQPGVQQARLLLAQRPTGCRPTGSIAETAALQALRGAGFGDILRQPLMIAPDEHGNSRQHFLDLFVVDHLLDVEVDGGEHLEVKRRQADRERDRRLSLGVGVVRVSAVEALNSPERAVSVVREEIARRRHEQRTLSPNRRADVLGADHRWEIVRRHAAA
jgi:hypothetical protein